MIELFAAINAADVASKTKDDIARDILERCSSPISEAVLDELDNNLSKRIEFVKVMKSKSQLIGDMEQMYEFELCKDECELARIRISIDVEIIKK